MMPLDNTDKKLLNLIQLEVPIVSRPFAALGEKLGGVSEAEVMERVNALKTGNVVRQISAIFDTRSLGYQSSLVAVKCDPKKEDEVAAVINAHPGVSHNYRRNHAYNIWYTVAVAPNSKLGLEKTVQILHEKSGAITTRLMPTLHLFKIGVELDVEGTAKADEKAPVRYSQKDRAKDSALTDLEMAYIREMQKDLEIEPEPFEKIAARIGIDLQKLQEIGDAMMQAGKMRRFSAVLNHRKAGFTANGMGVWAVRDKTDEEFMRIGEKMASFRAVSHCYKRPTYPDWPYNIFTMVHARTVADCDKILAEISKETGIAEYEALYSTKEYKKTRVEYFTEAERDWEARHVSAA
jgi:DNA-binding Lrp family transcriptional regulator